MKPPGIHLSLGGFLFFGTCDFLARNPGNCSDYFVFLGLHLAGLMIRTGYELLKEAGRVNTKSKPLFTTIFMAMGAMWVSWFGMCPLDPLHLALPNMVRWMGLGGLVVGLGLAIGALFQLRGLENIEHLITTGLFSKVRHPMYTGFILWILGWGIFHGAVVSLGAGLVSIGNILYWRRLEEANMESRYGEDYRRYRKGTWF
jgi:protein-S-isoprenylcysteine O-methyltransferase Ste14